MWKISLFGEVKRLRESTRIVSSKLDVKATGSFVISELPLSLLFVLWIFNQFSLSGMASFQPPTSKNASWHDHLHSDRNRCLQLSKFLSVACVHSTWQTTRDQGWLYTFTSVGRILEAYTDGVSPCCGVTIDTQTCTEARWIQIFGFYPTVPCWSTDFGWVITHLLVHSTALYLECKAVRSFMSHANFVIPAMPSMYYLIPDWRCVSRCCPPCGPL